MNSIILIALIGRVLALVPVDGLIKGNVSDSFQYDPLEQLLSYNLNSEQNHSSYIQLKTYQELQKQGASLKYSCEYTKDYSYADSWQEYMAKKSIASALQYIGLDLSVKAMAAYAKKLDMPKEQYLKFVDDLVTKTCSDNITVYSKRLLKNNLKNFYDKGQFSLPDLESSHLLPEQVKQLLRSKQRYQREFYVNMLVFRDLCSWEGKRDEYQLLHSYLANPFLMNIVFNSMLGTKLVWNNQKKKVESTTSSDKVSVVCENLICRRRSFEDFANLYPFMIGSSGLRSDLEYLWCGHFRNPDIGEDLSGVMKQWISSESLDMRVVKPLYLVSLMTKVPELNLVGDSYQAVQDLLLTNINSFWDDWAQKLNSEFIIDLLYEEAMQVELDSQVGKSQNYLGNFQLIFDYRLGELDHVLDSLDKIRYRVELKFPHTYISWMRSKAIYYTNKSQHQKMQALLEQFEVYIENQLKEVDEQLLVSLWPNKKFSQIVANELINQMLFYKGNKYSQYSTDTVIIPIQLNMGLFALKYLHTKFQHKYRLPSLTFDYKTPN